MRILVIDGQGGKLGSQLVKRLGESVPGCEITAVGTNAVATSAMLKSGATHAATGENPVVVACRKADVIVGPLGIVIADSMNGEITPAMALAVARANAARVLVPVNKCDNIVAGARELPVSQLVDDVADAVAELAKQICS